MQRELLLRFNSCNLTTFGKELTLGGHTYIPGLVLVNEFGADSTSRVEASRPACSLIHNEPVGQRVIAEIIDRPDHWTNWTFHATHLLILSGLTNYGFNRVEIDLLIPERLLEKSEEIVWSDEFTRRKYGRNVDWFSQISEADQRTERIELP